MADNNMKKEAWLSENDPNSFANTADVKITHSHLDLDVNFDKRILEGSVTHSFRLINQDTSKILLDTRDVVVKSVVDCATNEELPFCVAPPVKSFGSKLEINSPGSGPQFDIKVSYETSPSCSALQWLNPGQTAGKVHPYMFSQCQAIHCRSLMPCQDTPEVKFTYSAKIRVTSDLVVLMSAIKQSTERDKTDATRNVHNFHQKVPVPSYLMAIVAGALESRKIGPRSRVWSEKEMVDAAAFEFSETESMLQCAEQLMGPYVWGVYDLLLLPPSFPYGGMENPCLTFVTPTLLAGDRSLASVVAHEITHSWMGNLVTTKNWQHFWLNEGHTVFVERKILSQLKDEKHRHLAAMGGWKDLSYQVLEVFGADNPYTCLVPDLSGVDPDDAFSSTPYEKGSSLLMCLEQALGGPAVFEKFIRAYVDKFQYQSITTDQWKSFLYEHFADKTDVLDAFDWDAWFYKPGMPPSKPQFDGSLSEACGDLAARWGSCQEERHDTFSDTDIKTMSPPQIKEFLAQMLDKPSLPVDKVQKMGDVYKMDEFRNSEIKFRWLRLCLRAKREDSVQKALDFVNEQGRMKFVRPIYRDLYNWEESRPIAVANYRENCKYMHQLTASMVAKDMKLAES